MPRDCNCAGGCGPQTDGVSRREFIQLVGVGAAGTLAASAADAAAQMAPTQQEELARWKQSLHKPGPPRRYGSDTHKDARFPLGGIGTGNFEVGSDGQFTTWQLFNTLRDGFVPLLFAVKTGKAAKILQTTGGPGLPNIERIQMTGEYPIVSLGFEDKEVPLQIEMTALSPFAPLDTRLSSMPAVAFIFRITNPTQQKQTVSLAAMMQNPVGYDAMGVPISFNSVGFNQVPPAWGVHHPNFGGNVNSVHDEPGLTTLEMRAEPRKEVSLDKPAHLFTNLDLRALNAPPEDRPKGLTVQGLEAVSRAPVPENRRDANPPARIILLEEPAANLHESVLRDIRDAVRAGATLVISGRQLPLLAQYAEVTGGKPIDAVGVQPDIVFEDFEHGYGKWKVEGAAFGDRPPSGTLPGQQAVSGFVGSGLVNSFKNGDDTTGKLTSQPFTLERRYIRFLVGGGSGPNTQIRLLVDGKVVRGAAGKENERLLPAVWDVRDLKGKTAHIEIVDEQMGGWGHINIDQIEFSDLPGNLASMRLLEELLPVRFSRVRPASTGPAIFDDVRLVGGAEQSSRAYNRTIGKGRVVLMADHILDPAQVELTGARQSAYGELAAMAGIKTSGGRGIPATAPGFGTLALATTGPNRTAWTSFTEWKTAWLYFKEHGWFDRASPPPVENAPTAAGSTVLGALASTVNVGAGHTVEVPFFLTWRYPNKYNGAGVHMGNHYAELWPTARAAVTELARSLPAIREKTMTFKGALYESSLPDWLLDCVSSQISTIRHIGVLFRIANGDTYGWEGSNGCCQPTCTHVWGYEQTLARLFPDLERDMRRIDLKHQQRPDGGINNRTDVPSPPHPTGEQPFVDGHASGVLKAYREALNHPNDDWLKEHWPNIKKAVDYLISRDPGTAKGEPEGILNDDQWNTYDEALHGVSTFIGTYYLAALRAGEEMARRVGEQAVGNRYRLIFERGRDKLDQMCWNGEYYQQVLPDYDKRPGEFGPGCLSDQLIGQWWAHQLGLGYLLPPDRIKTALASIFKYNWLPDHTNWKHNWRKFAGGTDKGLLICAWPKGGRPANPILYCDEVWTGVEYQVAAHMIYEGMIDEAYAIIKGARDRYDGVRRDPMPRSPWNEIECGGHYARAMSSWSILLALSGFELDAPRGILRFMPKVTPEDFKCFFTGPEGWGNLRQSRSGGSQRCDVFVREGALTVSEFRLDAPAAKSARVTLNGVIPCVVKPAMTGTIVRLSEPVRISAGKSLRVTLR